MENDKKVKWLGTAAFSASFLVLGIVLTSWFTFYYAEPGKVWVLPEYKHVAEVAEFEITAYDAHSAQSINVSKWRDGRTALNRPAVSGYTIAVDPRIIPFDSFVYLPGIGWRVAEDVGGAIKGYRIDVLMETKKDAMKFGRQKLHALWIAPQPEITKIKKKVVKKQTIPKKKRVVRPKKSTKK
jgi:3D (Asp-Asp-Asp) domain-containing protein